MFRGIVEGLGQVKTLTKQAGNLYMEIKAPFHKELVLGQSLAHNGLCLTVAAIKKDSYKVCVIEESYQRSALGDLQEQSFLNLERALRLQDRVDGHFLQGHIDTTGKICGLEKSKEGGSWEILLSYPASYHSLVAHKGSIALDGISLTVMSKKKHKDEARLSVCIIPYTYQHSNVQHWQEGQRVNIEFDFLGKYVQNMLAQ